ncbi:MAG: M24 family metallopeptidase [Acidimicrobiales bacterium]
MQRADEVKAKLESLRAWLDHSDLDAALITSQDGFAWVTGGGDNTVTLAAEAGAASVLVTREDAYLLAANNELRRLVDEQAAGAGLTPVDWAWHEAEGESRIVERLCDPARSVSDLGRLGLPAAPPDMIELRFTLVAPEVERYRALGADTAEAVEVAVMAACPGDREIDIAARLVHECGRRGIAPLVTLVGADERIVQHRHPLPSGRRLARTLLVSLSGRRHGLHASLTRMAHFGGRSSGPAPADLDLASRFAAVRRIDARLIAESGAGALLGDVFEHGVDQYQREGFATEWQLHHQGGLTGYAGREVFATPSSRHVLRPGQAVAWNPTIPGVKSEDTILVGTETHEVLTATPVWPCELVEVAGATVARPNLLVR